MSDNAAEPLVDPWAWLHEETETVSPPWADYPVTAVIQTVRGEPWTTRCRQAAESGRVVPTRIMTIADAPAADADAAWLWFLPDSCEPAPDALAELVTRVHAQPDIDIVGPLLVEPRRRGPGTLVSDWGQTMTRGGRLKTVVEPGELYQGQLATTAVLGVPAAGMLVRGEVWRDLGGFILDLPASHWGIELGWRANLAGHTVVAEPRGHVVTHAEADDPVLTAAAGLTLVTAHAAPSRRWLTGLWLALRAVLAAIGFALGKDPGRAGAELRGLGLWLRGWPARRATESAVDRLAPSPAALSATRALLPARWSGVRGTVDAVAARISEWFETFTDRSDASGLDELTGDDVAGHGPAVRRVPVVTAGLATLLVLAVVAGRQLWGAGSLSGAQLLAAPDSWADLFGDYLAAPPGTAGLSSPPWQGIFALASLATFGRPEWLVTLVLLGCVPLAWLAAFRLLRQLVDDVRLAAFGASAYALAPVLLGTLNLGSFGAASWTLLVPVAGYSLWWWHGPARGTWRAAGAVALWLTLACSLVPLAWLLVLVAAVVMGLRGRSSRLWGQVALVAAGPLLLLCGPWAGTIARYPGRLLTGIEPTLAPMAAPAPWELLVAGTGGAAGPPLWVSLVVMTVVWLAAVAGATRRPGFASLSLVAAAGALVASVSLTRLVVWVPPGSWARPEAAEWQVLMVGGLVLAACVGLDGIGAELRERALGLRHLATLGLALSAVASLTFGALWWAVAGQAGLSRDPVGAVPAFVRNAQVSSTPSRTLALEVSDGVVGWSLIQDDFPRLGDVERGLVVSGDPQAEARALSVVNRLVTGSTDEQLLADLVSLGVAHIWLGGGGEELQASISNVPGLGVGTGNDAQTVWPVPDSARAIIEAGSERIVTGAGLAIPAGDPGRRLVLAEPVDDRWRAAVGSVPLRQVALPDGRQGFELGSAAGTLAIGLTTPSPWWAWVQLAGLAFLVLLAAPGLRRRTEEPTPLRAESAAPRRMAGGES